MSSYLVPSCAVPVCAGMIVAVPLELAASPLKSGRDLEDGDRSALVVGGTGKIRTGGTVVFCKVVAVAEAQVTRDGQVRAKGTPCALARLDGMEDWLDAQAGPGVIDGIADRAVLDKRYVKGERERLLTAAFMIRVLVLWTLMPEAQLSDVITALAGDLALVPWSKREWRPASERACLDWRKALGPAPLEDLQAAVLGAAREEHREHAGDGEALTVGRKEPLEVKSADGSLLRVPDTPANRAAFGSVGTADDSAAWPCVRLFPLNDCSDRSLLGMPWGPAGTDKAAAEQRLLDAAMRDFAHVFAKGQVWLLDRLWHGTGRLAALAQRTHFLVRLKSDIPLKRTSVTLPDGSYRAEIAGDGVTMEVRVIEYDVDVEGQKVEEMFCLVTDLLDWQDYPALELARLYKWRWDGSETAVRHEAHCYIARRAGRDERRYLWIQCLTGARKSEWENSMAENRRPCPDVRGGAPGDPHDKAKVGLPEAQSPAGGIGHPSERHLKPVPASAAGWRGARRNPLRPGAMPSQGIQGDGKAA